MNNNKKEINLELIVDTKVVTFQGNYITIKKYLNIEEKLNIAETVLQEAIDFNFVNPFKVEALFNALVCIKYTNIDFSNYVEDMYNLYDIVETTGLLQLVVDTSFADYKELKELTEELVCKYETYQSSLSGVVDRTLLTMPEKLKESINQLEELDTSKLIKLYDGIVENGGNENAIVNAIVGSGQK